MEPFLNFYPRVWCPKQFQAPFDTSAWVPTCGDFGMWMELDRPDTHVCCGLETRPYGFQSGSLEIICNLRGPTKLHYELSEHFGTQRCSPKRSQGYQAIPLRKHCLGPSRIAAIDPLGPWSFSGVISGGEGFGTVDA